MINNNWRDLYDTDTDTRMRVSPEVLQQLGRDGALQIALHVKASNPIAGLKDAPFSKGYSYTANGAQYFAGVFLLKDRFQRVPVFLIDTWEHWAEYHLDKDGRN